jgi:hypothetical protein
MDGHTPLPLWARGLGDACCTRTPVPDQLPSHQPTHQETGPDLALVTTLSIAPSSSLPLTHRHSFTPSPPWN